MERLRIEGISRSFDGERVLEGMSITPNKGELVSLLGISGNGKTTLSDIIVGLSRPDTRHVLLDGEDVTGCPGWVSYMLQENLFLLYWTIEDNVTPPLIVKGMKEREARRLTPPCSRQLGLEDTQEKYPFQLSGGVRQRAALLRTYLSSGGTVLSDELFSALDMMAKGSVRSWYLKVMGEIHLPTLLITHGIDEAVLLSDRIYLLTGRFRRITEELIIEETGPRGRDFGLTTEFLEYRRHILKHLERIV